MAFRKPEMCVRPYHVSHPSKEQSSGGADGGGDGGGVRLEEESGGKEEYERAWEITDAGRHESQKELSRRWKRRRKNGRTSRGPGDDRKGAITDLYLQVRGLKKSFAKNHYIIKCQSSSGNMVLKGLKDGTHCHEKVIGFASYFDEKC